MRILIAAALGLLAAGCATPPPVPIDQYYNFNIPPAAESLAGAAKLTVVVEPFATNGVYGERPLIYRQGEALIQYPEHFWSEPPSLALNDALVQYLRSAGFSESYTPLSRASADLVVRCRMRRMELVRQPTGAKSVLSLEFLVTKLSENRVIAVDFNQELATEDSPAGHARATSQLLSQAFARLSEKLATLPRY